LELDILDEATGEIVTTEVAARNCYAPDQVKDHQGAFLQNEPRDGTDLWERRAKLLPYLEFIPRVRPQVVEFKRGDRAFRSAYARLADINRDIGIWTERGTPHPDWSFYVRPESDTRINAGLVDFQLSDGSTQTFSDHADFGPIEGRIHFRVEVAPCRHALIGHVGRKLGIG
jgi:hypothetical protein